MIKNLIFDFGKVLVCYDFTAFLRTFIDDDAERYAFEQIVAHPKFVERCDLGVDSFEDIIREHQQTYPHWARQFQIFYDRQLEAVTHEMPGMRDLLIRLKNKGYKLYGLSNWGNTIYPVMEKFDIFRLLDDRIISSEEKIVKPDMAIYNLLCERFNLIPQECLFTDDKHANIDAAQASGMQAVLFTDTDHFEQDLKRLGVLPA